jgi:hypothetical protein
MKLHMSFQTATDTHQARGNGKDRVGPVELGKHRSFLHMSDDDHRATNKHTLAYELVVDSCDVQQHVIHEANGFSFADSGATPAVHLGQQRLHGGYHSTNNQQRQPRGEAAGQDSNAPVNKLISTVSVWNVVSSPAGSSSELAGACSAGEPARESSATMLQSANVGNSDFFF